MSIEIAQVLCAEWVFIAKLLKASLWSALYKLQRCILVAVPARTSRVEVCAKNWSGPQSSCGRRSTFLSSRANPLSRHWRTCFPHITFESGSHKLQTDSNTITFKPTHLRTNCRQSHGRPEQSSGDSTHAPTERWVCVRSATSPWGETFRRVL